MFRVPTRILSSRISSSSPSQPEHWGSGSRIGANRIVLISAEYTGRGGGVAIGFWTDRTNFNQLPASSGPSFIRINDRDRLYFMGVTIGDQCPLPFPALPGAVSSSVNPLMESSVGPDPCGNLAIGGLY